MIGENSFFRSFELYESIGYVKVKQVNGIAAV
jgi:hypothetical protein